MKPAFIDLGEMPGIRTDTHAKDGTPLRAMCTCYPSNPELRQGCSHENQCWVLGNARKANQARRLGQRLDTEAAQPFNPESPTAHARRRLLRLGVPVERLDDAMQLITPKALSRRWAEEWWAGDKGKKPTLVLAGPTGVAKSTAAAWVALKWGEQWPWNEQPSGGKQPQPFVWLDGVALQRIGGFDSNAAVMLDACDSADLLIIDDAANEGTRQAIQAVSDVVRSRIERRRLTVLTTNVVSEAFRQRYGVPLADRLRHTAEAPDLRHEKSMRGAA